MSVAPEQLPIKRNTALLSAALAANSGMLQLSAAVASLTFVLVTGVDGAARPRARRSCSRPAPSPRCRQAARWTGSGACRCSPPASSIGAVGGSLAALGSALESARRARRARAAWAPRAARRCSRGPPPATCTRRSAARAASRSSSCGAVFGAILGPGGVQPADRRPRPRRRRARAAVARRRRRSWSSALVLVAVRPARPEADRRAPRRTARRRADRARPRRCASSSAGPASCRRCSPRRRASRVMVGVMTLTGSVVVDHQHHASQTVFPIIGAHVLGMYALVLVVGGRDRPDRPHARRSSAACSSWRCSVRQPALGESVAGHRRRALRARPRLEPLVRCRRPRSSRTARSRGSAAGCWASTTCSRA